MEEQADIAAKKEKQQEQKKLLKAAVKEAKQKKLSPKEQLLEAVANSKGQVRQKTLAK